jgi:hypothetical protein
MALVVYKLYNLLTAEMTDKKIKKTGSEDKTACNQPMNSWLYPGICTNYGGTWHIAWVNNKIEEKQSYDFSEPKTDVHSYT